MYKDLMELIPGESVLFDEVELFFHNKIYRNQPARTLQHVNICCEDEEKEFLIEMAHELKEVYPLISIKDIFIALIFSYYALNLGEQTEDYLTVRSFSRFADNYDDALNLYLLITTGDITKEVVHAIEEGSMELSNQNVNLSSQIRRHMFGLPYGGLRTRKKRRSKKKNKKNKRKNTYKK